MCAKVEGCCFRFHVVRLVSLNGLPRKVTSVVRLLCIDHDSTSVAVGKHTYESFYNFLKSRCSMFTSIVIFNDFISKIASVLRRVSDCATIKLLRAFGPAGCPDSLRGLFSDLCVTRLRAKTKYKVS